MLSTTLKRSTSLAPRVCAAVGRRTYAIEGMKGYNDREAAEESIYFRKEEEKLLRKLLAKVAKSAADADPAAAKAAQDAKQKALEDIVGAKLTPAEKAAILAWKETH